MLVLLLLFLVIPSAYAEDLSLFRWADKPMNAEQRIEEGQNNMDRAYIDPEFVLYNDLQVPVAPTVLGKRRKLKLTLKEAILLSLRYNPNVINSEIDRIIQRYDLRVAEYQFEWQYTLTGSLFAQDSRFQGINQPFNSNFLITPGASLKTSLGGSVAMQLPIKTDFHTWNPQFNLEFRQPLLRGLGSDVTLAPLRTAFDTEELNKLTLKANVIKVVTDVIKNYRALINANQQVLIQLNAMKAAEKTIRDNEAKIKAGQLETTANVQQQSQVEQIRLTYLQNLITQQNAAQILLNSIGLDPDIDIAVPDDVQVAKKLTVPDLQKTLDQALKNNIDYVSSLISFKGLKRQLLLQIDAQRWELNAVGIVQVGNQAGVPPDAGFLNLFNGRNRLESIALNLAVPINDIPRKQLLINARLTMEKAQIALTAQERALLAIIKNTLKALDIQIKQIQVAELTVQLAKQSYEIQLKKQQAGISDSILVTNAQDQYISSQSAVIVSKITYLNTVADLQALLATTLDEWGVKLRYG